MKILKDSIFKIGKAHSVCQDYATSITLPYRTRIAVSDGCSSSSNTDFGSRVIVDRAMVADYFRFDQLEIIQCLYDSLNLINKFQTIKAESLDATLLLADIWYEKFHVRIYGDGVFSYQLQDQTIKIVQTEFANNAPYYPAYEIFPERRESYLKIFGGQKTITEYTVRDGKIINTEVKIVKYNECCEYEFNIGDLKSFFLFSDGVETFHQVVKTETSKFTKDIPTVDSVLEIMNCPTFGPFLEKKYTKLSEQHAKQGIFHADDLSVAAFLFQEDIQ